MSAAAGVPSADERRQTIEALRARIARLGGLGGSAGAPAPRARRAEAPTVPRLPGFEPEDTPGGVAWVRRADVDLAPFLERAGARGPVTPTELLALSGRAGEAPPVVTWPAGDLAVLDIESLGLRGSGVVPFLVGIGVPHGHRLHVDQVLLADPGAETALLLAVLSRLAPRRMLVTYNGRTFDVPVLQARCIVNRLSDTTLDARLHCDVLAPVRRLFRDRLGACTLRQAEIGLLGMERVGDVPGAEAPARYRAWLRGAAPAVLDGVVRHNEVDLCATMVLAARLAAHVQGMLVEPVHPADRYRLGVHLERIGVEDAAESLYRTAFERDVAPWHRQAGRRLARRVSRRGGSGTAEAVRILLPLWRTDPCDLQTARALAIALERCGRLGEALDVCERSLKVCQSLPAWRLARLRAAPADGWEADWTRRAARLGQRRRRLLSEPTATARRSAAQMPPGVAGAGAGVTCPPLFAY